MNSTISFIELPGRKIPADPDRLELGDVDIGNDAPDHDQHVVQALLADQFHHARADLRVRPGEDRQPDDVGVLLERGGHHLFRGLAQAGVDHLHARVAKAARNHLGAAVVAVEARLGDHDSDLTHKLLQAPPPACGPPWLTAVARHRDTLHCALCIAHSASRLAPSAD